MVENAGSLGTVRDAVGGDRRMEMYRNPFHGWLRGTVAAPLSRGLEDGEVRDVDGECVADVQLAALSIDLYQRQELGISRVRCWAR